MRLALIGPVYPYRGGIAHYTTMLYRALVEREHKVLLVSFKRQYPQWLFPGQSDKDPSKESLQVKEAHYWIDSLNPLSWLKTFQHIRAYQPDLIIQQWWVTFWAPAWFVLGMLNRHLLGAPLLIICHNVLPHEAHSWDPWLARLVLRQGTHFITQSIPEKEQLLGLVPWATAGVCPLPTFDLFAELQVPKYQARERLGLPQGLPVLLFFGIVREYKGLRDLLAALPLIQERFGKLLLIVAGEFWDDKQPYLEAIRQLGIESSILIDDRYIPNEEVGLYFSAADALVAPYRNVTGSAVVPMAHGFGLPVVTTQLPGIAQAVHSEEDLLVPPADPEALAGAVIHLISDTRRSAQPRQRQESRFSWDQLVSLIEELAHV